MTQVIAANDEREGYRMLMQTAGLGGMQINTVAIPWMDVSVSHNLRTAAALALS